MRDRRKKGFLVILTIRFSFLAAKPQIGFGGIHRRTCRRRARGGAEASPPTVELGPHQPHAPPFVYNNPQPGICLVEACGSSSFPSARGVEFLTARSASSLSEPLSRLAIVGLDDFQLVILTSPDMKYSYGKGGFHMRTKISEKEILSEPEARKIGGRGKGLGHKPGDCSCKRLRGCYVHAKSQVS